MKYKFFFMLCCFICCMTVIHSASDCVSFHVYTGSKQPIVNASFSLYQEDQCIQEDILSDDTGCVRIMNLTSGSYHLKQESTQKGYEIYTDDICFSYEQGKPQILKDIINHELCGSVMVQLMDHEKKPLKESSFTLTSNHLKRTYTSDKKGYCKMDKLPLGTYEIRQGNASTEFSITQGNYDQDYILHVCLTPQIIQEKKKDPSLWILSTILLLCFGAGAFYMYRSEFLKQR